MRIILDRLVSLTKQSVPQSEISVSIYEFNLVPLAEALVEASRRGVNVRMVIDGKIKGDSAKSKSAVGIVTNGLPKGAVTFCSGGGCRGTHINHNKLFLFSRLENGDRFVVAQ
ncbi:MAG: phospholipase D-like domain-containing protein, partial [Bdellovibrionota bacterium]